MYTRQSSSGLGAWGWKQWLTFGIVGGDGVKREDAIGAVNQIYLELLERPAIGDPGSVGFVDCLVSGECDVDFVRTEVLSSPEFQRLQEVRVRKELEARRATTSAMAPGAAGAALPGLVAGLPSSVAGIPLTYIIGGFAALLLLRKKGR